MAGFAEAARALRDSYEGSYERFWEDFRSRPADSKPDDGNLVMTYGVAACFSATPEGARRWFDLGVRMVMAGVDTQILLPALRAVVAAARPQPHAGGLTGRTSPSGPGDLLVERTGTVRDHSHDPRRRDERLR